VIRNYDIPQEPVVQLSFFFLIDAIKKKMCEAQTIKTCAFYISILYMDYMKLLQTGL
jgi:hypothetical protein